MSLPDGLQRLARGLAVLLLMAGVAGFGLCGGWGLREGLGMVQHGGEQGAYGRVTLALAGLGLLIALSCLAKLIALWMRHARTTSTAPVPSSDEDTVLPPP